MKKNTIMIIVIIAAVLILAAAGYFYWKNKKTVSRPAASATSSVQSAVEAAGAITQSATQGVLPSIGGATNPLDNAPDLNPANKTNPFNSVKTNPFQ